MLKSYFLILFIFFQFSITVQEVFCQTSIRGRVLSADGRTIPQTVISIRPETKRDIFSGHYEDVFPGEDGSYQFQIHDPGIYRIFFRGVFHNGVSIPVMVYDQPSMTMNILLMPKYFNDGYYFDQDNYTEWIRITGNFNNYSYETGKKFSLNPDGSISAFVPINSDTLRYQVRGITYGRGSAVLPQADEFGLREDGSFEAVLYNNLPKDSLEIRYDPGRSIPFKRHLSDPDGVEPGISTLSGFISLQNQKNEHWIRPLGWLHPYNTTFRFVEWEMSEGIPIQTQKDVQKKVINALFSADLSEELEEISRDLSNDELHPQQKVILTMSYASVLGWMARKTLFQQMRSEQSFLHDNQPGEQVPIVNPDSEILMSIPEMVPPVHPAWMYNNGAVDYLLTESGDPETFIEYFYDVVSYHPDDRAVRFIALSIIRHFGSEYSSVEEMPVYQFILERYGENNLARDVQLAFRSLIMN